MQLCVCTGKPLEELGFAGVLSTHFLFWDRVSYWIIIRKGRRKSTTRLQKPATKPKFRITGLWVWRALTNNGTAKGIGESRWFTSILYGGDLRLAKASIPCKEDRERPLKHHVLLEKLIKQRRVMPETVFGDNWHGVKENNEAASCGISRGEEAGKAMQGRMSWVYLVTESKNSRWWMCRAWLPRGWGLLLHREEGLESSPQPRGCSLVLVWDSITHPNVASNLTGSALRLQASVRYSVTSAEDESQGCPRSRQVFYHLNHTPSPRLQS